MTLRDHAGDVAGGAQPSAAAWPQLRIAARSHAGENPAGSARREAHDVEPITPERVTLETPSGATIAAEAFSVEPHLPRSRAHDDAGEASPRSPRSLASDRVLVRVADAGVRERLLEGPLRLRVAGDGREVVVRVDVAARAHRGVWPTVMHLVREESPAQASPQAAGADGA